MTDVAADTAIHLRCLGPVSLTGPGGTPLTLRTRKQLGLLFYLARRRRAAGRDELIELFWSEDGEKLARHSLSQCCSLVNKTLGGDVIAASGRDRFTLAPGSVRLDVTDFERLVDDGVHDEALELWRGPLFEGFWVQRAPNFERWLADERDKVQRTWRRVAHVRIESLRHAGEHQAMREEAERLLQHDPLDEKAMLACLEALSLLGDRSLALRRYAEFEGRLRRELDADPGGALKGWARRARKGEAPAPDLDRLPAPRISEITVLPAVQPFFGRTEEFGMLWTAWETAGTGKGAFIIIEGEAGIGKTALATKLVNQAHVAGGSVCFVKCYRTEKSVPFAPVTTLIRQLSRLPGFVALDPVWIGELTRLVPELRERYPNVPQPMAVDDAARHRLSDAAVNAALAVADEQPLMIVVDDLQDADESSLALLHYLGRQTPSQAALLVGIARTGVELNEFEKTFFLTARTAGFCRTLPVRQLPDADISRLIEQVLAHNGLRGSSSLLSRLRASSMGNPLAAVEGALAWGREQVAGKHPPDMGQVPFMESAVARLSALNDDSRLVSQAIAIAGRPLSDYELVTITGLAPATLSAAITRLEENQFVRRFGSSVALAHERYSAAVQEVAEAGQVTELHQQLANLGVSAARTNPAMHFEAAKHFMRAGRSKEAADQAHAAANYAASMGAVRGKADALELLRSLPKPLGSTQLHELCSSYLYLNDLPRLRSLLHSSQCQGAEFAYYGIAADYQEGARSFLETESELEEYVRKGVRFGKAWRDACVLLMRVADKTGNYRRVRSIARLLRSDGRGAHALFGAAYVRMKYYGSARSYPLILRVLEAACEEGELELEQIARDGAGILLKQLGKYRDSIRQFEFSLGLARKTMNPHAEVACLNNRAVSEMCLGEWEAVRSSHAEAEKVGSAFARWGLNLFRAYNISLVNYYEGDYEQAIKAFESSHDSALRAGFLSLARESKAGLALVYRAMGKLEEMRPAVRSVVQMREDSAPSVGWIERAAVAHHHALEGNAELGSKLLAQTMRELARRDVSLELAAARELLILVEAAGLANARAIRQQLTEKARSVGADWIIPRENAPNLG